LFVFSFVYIFYGFVLKVYQFINELKKKDVYKLLFLSKDFLTYGTIYNQL